MIRARDGNFYGATRSGIGANGLLRSRVRRSISLHRLLSDAIWSWCADCWPRDAARSLSGLSLLPPSFISPRMTALHLIEPLESRIAPAFAAVFELSNLNG